MLNWNEIPIICMMNFLKFGIFTNWNIAKIDFVYSCLAAYIQLKLQNK